LGAVAVALASAPHAAVAGGFSWTEQGFYILDFALLIGLIAYAIKGPLKEFLEKRRENVLREMEAAQKLRAEAEAKLREYEQRLAELDAERKKILDDFTAAAARDRDKLLAEAQKSADRIVRDAERRVEQESKRLYDLLEREVITASLVASEELVRARVNAATQQKLLDEAVGAVSKSGDKLAAA
jgi:F-type H+-transporting ATPase subunit b